MKKSVRWSEITIHEFEIGPRNHSLSPSTGPAVGMVGMTPIRSRVNCIEEYEARKLRYLKARKKQHVYTHPTTPDLWMSPFTRTELLLSQGYNLTDITTGMSHSDTVEPEWDNLKRKQEQSASDTSVEAKNRAQMERQNLQMLAMAIEIRYQVQQQYKQVPAEIP